MFFKNPPLVTINIPSGFAPAQSIGVFRSLQIIYDVAFLPKN